MEIYKAIRSIPGPASPGSYPNITFFEKYQDLLHLLHQDLGQIFKYGLKLETNISGSGITMGPYVSIIIKLDETHSVNLCVTQYDGDLWYPLCNDE